MAAQLTKIVVFDARSTWDFYFLWILYKIRPNKWHHIKSSDSSDSCRIVASHSEARWGRRSLQCDGSVPKRHSHSDWCAVWGHLAVWRTEQHAFPSMEGLSKITTKKNYFFDFESDFLKENVPSIRVWMDQKNWSWQQTSLKSDFSWRLWRTRKLSRRIWRLSSFPGPCPQQVCLPIL